jgi:epoxyqueuosine reductase
MDQASRTQRVVERARALGFGLCGVVRVENLAQSEELARLPEWLARGYAGEMKYLHDARRQSPSSVLEGARSIIVCAINYNSALPYSTNVPRDPERGWISRYAWGDDYHEEIGKKLDALIAAMRTEFVEPFEALSYVDTGPILERAAAKLAGLGWLAKNTCLINAELGSWFFLGEIVTTLDLAPSLEPAEAPPADLCGNCSLCIDACPTEALIEPYVLDARRCISYLTIELRGSIPEDLRAPVGRHVFGCDICQDVCPYNRKAPTTSEPAFQPRGSSSSFASLFSPSLESLASLSEDEFRGRFRGSAVKRTKWRGLIRNACVALGNSSLKGSDAAYPRVRALLKHLAASVDPLIAEHAQWALDRITRDAD